MKFAKCLAVCLAVMTSGATGVAHADVLQNQVLAAARATRSDLYAFRRTLVVERTGAARQVFEEAFDPRRPAGQQWSLLSVDGRAPTAKEAEQSRKVKRGPVPFYGEIVKWFGAPATRNDGAPGYVTYRFAQLPPGALKIGSHDASADTQAEALVNTRGKVPIVEQVRLVSTKGFRMMLVASVQNISIGGRYHLLADGYPVPAESSSNLAGSLLGKAGTMRATVTYGAFQKVR